MLILKIIILKLKIKGLILKLIILKLKMKGLILKLMILKLKMKGLILKLKMKAMKLLLWIRNRIPIQPKFMSSLPNFDIIFQV